MLLSRGSIQTFIERPISMWVLILTVALLVWGLRSSLRQRSTVTMTQSPESI